MTKELLDIIIDILCTETLKITGSVEAINRSNHPVICAFLNLQNKFYKTGLWSVKTDDRILDLFTQISSTEEARILFISMTGKRHTESGKPLYQRLLDTIIPEEAMRSLRTVTWEVNFPSCEIDLKNKFGIVFEKDDTISIVFDPAQHSQETDGIETENGHTFSMLEEYDLFWRV